MEHQIDSTHANLPNRRSWLRMLVLGTLGTGMLALVHSVTRKSVRTHSMLVDAGSVEDVKKLVQDSEHASPLAGISAYAVGDPTSADGFQIRSSTCSHAGCPLKLSVKADRWLCGCHGGVFTASGKPIAGPPKEPLARLEHHIANGRLYVRMPSELR